MRNSLFVRWLLAACCLAFLSHLLLPKKVSPQVSPPTENGNTADDTEQQVVDDPDQLFVELKQFYNPSLDIAEISNIEAFETADKFLPYFALLPTLPNLAASDAIGTCDFTDEELKSFQYDSKTWWKVEQRPESEISPLRRQWQTFLQHSLVPWSRVSDRFSGKGIVFVAGDEESVKRLKVTLRVLREHLDTDLPVEVHFYEFEISEKTQDELVGIFGPDLHFNDLSLRRQTWQMAHYSLTTRGLNYQLKVSAMLNSRFSEILYLDSDNIPTVDPKELFSSNTYQKFGSVFWPDLTRTRPEHPGWRITNTSCRRDEYEFETGQVMVNKARFWYHLQLVAWMHTQPYWQRIVLGDKDLFRYAWHALRTAFGRPVKWITSIGFMAEQPNRGDSQDGDNGMHRAYCGHSYAQHHPDHSVYLGYQGSGIVFLHGGNLKKIGAPFAARLRAAEGGLFTHYKRLDTEKLEDWNHVEYGAGQKEWNEGWYLNLTRNVPVESLVAAEEDLNLDGEPIGSLGLERLEVTERDFSDITLCSDFRYITPTPIVELGWEELGYEVLFSRAGGYYMIEDGRRTGRTF